MNIKYEHSDDCKVCEYSKGVEKILKVLNHPEAYVTDESLIHDFLDLSLGMDEQQRSQWLEDLNNKLGFKVKFSSYIWEIAKKLEKADGET